MVSNVGLLVTSKEVTTSIDDPEVLNESGVGLVFPNPFSGNASLNINLVKEARLIIRLFDIAGRQVYFELTNLSAGAQKITLPAGSLQPGIYSLVLADDIKGNSVTRKIVKID